MTASGGKALKYAYEDLSDAQYETLVVLLCQKVLGLSVQGFAAGKDGGRDAKFVGTAERHPSSSNPWVGTAIIQAKHTNGYNRHFSDPDFFSADGTSNIIADEIPKIKKLKESQELDHYMLFANRRLSGDAEAAIRKHISEKCKIAQESIYLCGTDQMELWLKSFPDVPQMANLDPVDSPLLVSPDELAVVVQALAIQIPNVKPNLDPPSPRHSYEEKNRVNNMTKGYATALRKRYLKETAAIKSFLAAPESEEILKLYESVVDEFQLKIIAKRKEYQTFDCIMEYLFDLLFSRDPELSRNRRLTRAVLFYMYWNCDIGEVDDA